MLARFQTPHLDNNSFCLREWSRKAPAEPAALRCRRVMRALVLIKLVPERWVCTGSAWHSDGAPGAACSPVGL